ncbi:hypothetical protein [uncultured Aquimarina sp.]|uniref:hypothetical protein n=1 Tax=uncultured Aquimarina sp. TaxID=575652 RepID=UPI00262A4018|nr:hypothetical protein [uncultured Aquimarina sp.]
MLQNILKLEGIEILTKSKQKVIIAGQRFVCTCGFEGGGNGHIYLEGTLIDALQDMNSNCGGAGAQCDGV